MDNHLCNWQEGSDGDFVCSDCGVVRSSPRKRICKGHPVYARRCVKLGNFTGEIISISCLSCGGRRTESRYGVHTCDLHGRCIPYYRCTKKAVSEAYRGSGEMPSTCESCEDREQILLTTQQ